MCHHRISWRLNPVPVLSIRSCEASDRERVIALWRQCDLVVPWNDPAADIRRKLDDSPELFFVAEAAGQLVASCMAGYDGHRGWIYYLAVAPARQREGIARRLVEHAESALAAIGCPKVDLMIRDSNHAVQAFYRSIGYSVDAVQVMSKRLVDDG